MTHVMLIAVADWLRANTRSARWQYNVSALAQIQKAYHSHLLTFYGQAPYFISISVYRFGIERELSISYKRLLHFVEEDIIQFSNTMTFLFTDFNFSFISLIT